MDYKRRFKVTGGIPDSYEVYRKDKKSKGETFLDKNMYITLCHEFNKRISNKIIKESFEFKIPHGLGYLRIKTMKLKYRFKDGKLNAIKSCPNWYETRKLWSRLYPDKTWEEIKEIPDKKILVHTNEHTDGKVMRWYWDKRLSNFTNQTVYSFDPVKGVQDNNYYENSDNIYYGRIGLGKWILNPERNNEYYE